jgi:hypothetical protein
MEASSHVRNSASSTALSPSGCTQPGPASVSMIISPSGGTLTTPDRQTTRQPAGCGRQAVHPGSARAGIARDPRMRHGQRRRVVHEIEQVIEPGAGSGHHPTVKLGLHPRYPRPRHARRGPRRLGAANRRRVLRHCSLLPFSVPPAPFPMRRALPGSEYYGGSAPSQAARARRHRARGIPPGTAVLLRADLPVRRASGAFPVVAQEAGMTSGTLKRNQRQRTARGLAGHSCTSLQDPRPGCCAPAVHRLHDRSPPKNRAYPSGSRLL